MDRREALDVADYVIIKLAANVIVDRNRDWHLCISWQLSFIGREDQSDSLIVAKEELLLFLEDLGLRECVTRYRAKFLRLFVLIG